MTDSANGTPLRRDNPLIHIPQPKQSPSKKPEEKTDNSLQEKKDLKKALPTEKKPPIQREQQSKKNETKKDEEEMQKGTPIVKRIQKKEEEALGKTHDNQTFSERLEELSKKPETILMKTKTLFPFDPFPDIVTIDPIKINIETRYFFLSKKIQTILIKDIIDTAVEEAPLMATLIITTNEDKEHPTNIAGLKKAEAEKAMQIIQGLVIGRSEAPDVGKLESIR